MKIWNLEQEKKDILPAPILLIFGDHLNYFDLLVEVKSSRILPDNIYIYIYE